METMAFAPLLERVDRELNLPQPQKSRLLEELAADAAGLHAHLRTRGVPEPEAMREVERWLAAAPETVRQLESIHSPLYLRWASRLSEPGRRRMERAALAVVVLCTLLATIPLALGGALGRAPFASGWLVVLLGVGSCAVMAERWFALWVRKDHGGDRRRGLGFLVGAALLAPTVSALGGALALSGLAFGDPDHARTWSVVQTSSGLLAAGLIVGLLAGAFRFTVESRARWIERLDHSWKEE